LFSKRRAGRERAERAGGDVQDLHVLTESSLPDCGATTCAKAMSFPSGDQLSRDGGLPGGKHELERPRAAREPPLAAALGLDEPDVLRAHVLAQEQVLVADGERSSGASPRRRASARCRSPRRRSRARRGATRSARRRCRGDVSRRASPPLIGMSQSWALSAESGARNASVRPSGEKRASLTARRSKVSCRSTPLVTSTA
jgi:hypothetical protein